MRMRSFFAPRHLQPLRAIHTPSSALPSSLRAAQQSHEDKQLRAQLQLQLRRMLSIGVCLLGSLVIFTYGSFKGIKWFGQLVLLALVLLPTLWLWLKELPLRVLRRMFNFWVRSIPSENRFDTSANSSMQKAMTSQSARKACSKRPRREAVVGT